MFVSVSNDITEAILTADAGALEVKTTAPGVRDAGDDSDIMVFTVGNFAMLLEFRGYEIDSVDTCAPTAGGVGGDSVVIDGRIVGWAIGTNTVEDKDDA